MSRSGSFVQAQALHDLRNLFSRLSGNDRHCPRLPRSPDPGAGPLRHLIPADRRTGGPRSSAERRPLGRAGARHRRRACRGLAGLSGQSLLDGAARRMRALTGFDRVTLDLGGRARRKQSRQFQPARPGCSPIFRRSSPIATARGQFVSGATRSTVGACARCCARRPRSLARVFASKASQRPSACLCRRRARWRVPRRQSHTPSSLGSSCTRLPNCSRRYSRCDWRIDRAALSLDSRRAYRECGRKSLSTPGIHRLFRSRGIPRAASSALRSSASGFQPGCGQRDRPGRAR